MIDKAIILSIGNKTHSSQLIYSRARTMLPALGKPLVVRAMDRLHRIGIKKYVVVLGENEANIATYLNKKWMPNVSIEFLIKTQSRPLAETLHKITQSNTDPCLIVSYNSFTHANFAERILKYHDLSPRDLILAGARNSMSSSPTHIYGCVSIQPEGQYTTEPRSAAEVIHGIDNQPNNDYQNLILTDVLAAGIDFMTYLKNMPAPDQKLEQLLDIAKAFHRSGKIIRVARSSWVLQIKNDMDLITLNHYLLDEKIDAHILSELPYTVRVRPPVRIDPGVSIGQGAIIGPYVYLETGCNIGRGARVSNAIITGSAVVNPDEIIDNAIVYSRGKITR